MAAATSLLRLFSPAGIAGARGAGHVAFTCTSTHLLVCENRQEGLAPLDKPGLRRSVR